MQNTVPCLCTDNSQCSALLHCDLIQGSAHYGQCLHDDPFPANARAVITFILIPIVIGVANVGGLSAGITKVPLIVLMLNYTTQMATIVTYPLTLGSIIPNVVSLLFQRHPEYDRPLPDFSIAMLLIPGVLLGTNIGLIMNNLLPDLVLNLSFMTFLVWISPNIYKKARKLYRDENKKLVSNNETKNEIQADVKMSLQPMRNPDKLVLEGLQDPSSIADIQKPGFEQLVFEDNSSTQLQQPFTISSSPVDNIFQSKKQDQELDFQQDDILVEQTAEKKAQLQKILRDERRILPPLKILFLLTCLGFLIFFRFSMGSSALHSFLGIKMCTIDYWFVFAAQCLVYIMLSFLAYKYVKKEIQQKHSCSYKFSKNDLQSLEITQHLLLTFGGFFGGFLSGMLGAGAGLMIVPMLLNFNLLPRVVAGTSQIVLFFFSWASIIVLVTSAQLETSTILWYLLLGFLGVFLLALVNLLGSILYIVIQAHNKCYGWTQLLAMRQYCPKK